MLKPGSAEERMGVGRVPRALTITSASIREVPPGTSTGRRRPDASGSLSLVAWGRFYNDFGGQMLVLFIIAVAACEAAIALAMILMLFRRRGSLDIALWQELREANVPEHVDHEVPEDEEPPAEWPRLPPAGVAPQIPREETDYRSHV